MSMRAVASFVITCDARRCDATTGVHATEHDAWRAWRSEHDGMLFLAGMYAGGQEPQEYLCGKHWHIGQAGHYMKGQEVRDDSKAA